MNDYQQQEFQIPRLKRMILQVNNKYLNTHTHTHKLTDFSFARDYLSQQQHIEQKLKDREPRILFPLKYHLSVRKRHCNYTSIKKKVSIHIINMKDEGYILGNDLINN